MTWRGALALLAGVVANFFLLLFYYLLFLAIVGALLPPSWTLLNRFLLYALMVLAAVPAWLTWKRLARLLKEHLHVDWEPDWDFLVRKITGKR